MLVENFKPDVGQCFCINVLEETEGTDPLMMDNPMAFTFIVESYHYQSLRILQRLIGVPLKVLNIYGMNFVLVQTPFPQEQIKILDLRFIKKVCIIDNEVFNDLFAPLPFPNFSNPRMCQQDPILSTEESNDVRH